MLRSDRVPIDWNQRATLLRITPAVKNITSNVKSIQFEHLYYYTVSKDIITHIVPGIRSEFGKLVQFKYTDPLYVFHFRPRVYEILQIAFRKIFQSF